MSTLEQVSKIISTQLGSDNSTVKASDDIIKDLKLDSLDVVEVIMSIEEQFDLSLPDEQAEKLRTVQSLVNYVDQNKKS